MNLIQRYRKLATYKLIHLYSLVLGFLFKKLYWLTGENSVTTTFFLNRYINSRRLLPGGYDPKLGRSTRLGAFEAYQSTQDD
jgi:hypothetical protein